MTSSICHLKKKILPGIKSLLPLVKGHEDSHDSDSSHSKSFQEHSTHAFLSEFSLKKSASLCESLHFILLGEEVKNTSLSAI